MTDRPSTPARVTAADSERDQRRAAAALAARGFARGDRIAIVATGTPAYLALSLGALRTGIVPLLLSPHLTERELQVLLPAPASGSRPTLPGRHLSVERLHDDPAERDGTGVGDVDTDVLGAWLREQVAPHKRPKLIVSVTEIPVSPTGKVRRSVLGADLGLG